MIYNISSSNMKQISIYPFIAINRFPSEYYFPVHD
nr:MAG TPA: hypothetical protein [Caudoviricetes sp.]